MISVIIPAFNSAEFLPGAIESVLSQTCRDHEIIVVDDGSSDGTRDVIEPYLNRIRYIYQDNQGPSAARNTGLHAARGKHVAFLDADDLWFPDKLERQMAEATEPVLVGCGLQVINREGHPGETIFKWRTVEEFRNQIGWYNVFGNPSCALTFKSVFDDVGYFNEKLRYGEDWEMWLRISRRYPVRLAPKALVKFRIYDGVKTYENIDLKKSCIREIIGNFTGSEKYLNQRKAFSHMYTELAWTALQKGDRVKSIIFATRAVLLHPCKAHRRDQKRMLLVRTLLPVPVLDRLLRIKSILTIQNGKDARGFNKGRRNPVE